MNILGYIAKLRRGFRLLFRTRNIRRSRISSDIEYLLSHTPTEFMQTAQSRSYLSVTTLLYFGVNKVFRAWVQAKGLPTPSLPSELLN